jgi:hypothetical protein
MIHMPLHGHSAGSLLGLILLPVNRENQGMIPLALKPFSPTERRRGGAFISSAIPGNYKKNFILGLIDFQKFYKIATIRGNQGVSPMGFIKSLSPFNKEKNGKTD